MEYLKEDYIKVCLKCGSTNLDAIPGGQYSAFTNYGFFLSGYEVCMDCGHIGAPIILDDREYQEDFTKYIEDLKEEGTSIPETWMVLFIFIIYFILFLLFPAR